MNRCHGCRFPFGCLNPPRVRLEARCSCGWVSSPLECMPCETDLLESAVQSAVRAHSLVCSDGAIELPAC